MKEYIYYIILFRSNPKTMPRVGTGGIPEIMPRPTFGEWPYLQVGICLNHTTQNPEPKFHKS
jgi:hypothetical protein